MSEATKAKIGAKARARVGWTHSEETLAKMRTACTKRAPMSDETRRKISESRKGMVYSAERRQKLSEVHRARYVANPGLRKRISESLKQASALDPTINVRKGLGAKLKWEDPIWRKEQTAKRKRRANSDEGLAHMREMNRLANIAKYGRDRRWLV